MGKKSRQATFIDNMGAGNCMYYAYAISLMHYLKSQDDPSVQQGILRRIGLSEAELRNFNELLNNRNQTGFSKAELKTIQNVLGARLRAFGASETARTFRESPRSHPTFACIDNAINRDVYLALIEMGRADLVALLDEPDDSAYRGAELFRVTRPRNIRQDIRAHAQEVAETLDLKFPPDSTLPNKSDLGREIQDEASVVMTKDNEALLTAYCEHLGRNYEWGTDETLFMIHSGITGERRVRNPNTGLIEIEYDYRINLAVTRRGQPSFDNGSEQHIVLQNQGNAHWVSEIPATVRAKLVDDNRRNQRLAPLRELLVKIYETMDALDSKDDHDDILRVVQGLNRVLTTSIINKSSTAKDIRTLEEYQTLEDIYANLKTYADPSVDWKGDSSDNSSDSDYSETDPKAHKKRWLTQSQAELVPKPQETILIDLDYSGLNAVTPLMLYNYIRSVTALSSPIILDISRNDFQSWEPDKIEAFLKAIRKADISEVRIDGFSYRPSELKDYLQERQELERTHHSKSLVAKTLGVVSGLLLAGAATVFGLLGGTVIGLPLAVALGGALAVTGIIAGLAAGFTGLLARSDKRRMQKSLERHSHSISPAPAESESVSSTPAESHEASENDMAKKLADEAVAARSRFEEGGDMATLPGQDARVRFFGKDDSQAQASERKLDAGLPVAENAQDEAPTPAGSTNTERRP